MSKSNSSSSGISTIGLLGVALVVLKLIKIIDWSWWWVTLPFWGGIVVFVIVFIALGLLAMKPKKPTIVEQLNKKPRSKFAERLEEAKNKQLNKK